MSFSMAGIKIEPKATVSFPRQFIQVLCPAATEVVAQYANAVLTIVTF